jgi:hypothetical protein
LENGHFFLIDVTETFFSDITPMDLDTSYFSLKNRTERVNNQTHFRYETDGTGHIFFLLKNRTQYFNNWTHFRYETDGSVSLRYGYQYEMEFFRYEVRYQVISDPISVFLVCSEVLNQLKNNGYGMSYVGNIRDQGYRAPWSKRR